MNTDIKILCHGRQDYVFSVVEYIPHELESDVLWRLVDFYIDIVSLIPFIVHTAVLKLAGQVVATFSCWSQ